MHPKFVSKGVQNSGNAAEELEALRPAHNFYMTRKDVLAIKRKLQDIVSNEKEYWSTLSLFLHGGCSKSYFDSVMSRNLISDEAKFFHNKLLRAILYNAHFSCIPPPGVNIERVPKQIVKRKNEPSRILEHKPKLYTYSMYDFRKIPILDIFLQRMKKILGEKPLDVDKQAALLAKRAIINYILEILQDTLKFSMQPQLDSETIVIKVQDVYHVLKNNVTLSSTVSHSVFTKYSALL